MWKAIHPATHFTEDIAFCIRFVMETIFINNVLWEEFEFHSEVLKMVLGSHEVEVADVNSHEFCIGDGDDAVEHEFDR